MRLNRQVTLLNCDKICPAMAHILINTYCSNSYLFVDGQCLLSEEGTTQGDPLAMALYVIGTLPLIHRLDGLAKQTWYADDSAAASRLEQLRSWWDLLNEIGPLYGYFPNGAKTHNLVKSQSAYVCEVVSTGCLGIIEMSHIRIGTLYLHVWMAQNLNTLQKLILKRYSLIPLKCSVNGHPVIEPEGE